MQPLASICTFSFRASLLVTIGVAFIIAYSFSYNIDTSTNALIARKLSPNSGSLAQTVKGEYSGAEKDELAKAMGKAPDYTLPFPMVLEYLTALWQWDRNGGPNIPDSLFTSVALANLTDALPSNFTKYAVPGMLRGVWCGPTHPSDLACFVPYPSDKEHLPKAKGLPAQGFTPGHIFMWDSPGARNTLEFFTRFDTEFQFPKFAENLTNTTGSAIWNSARRPFEQIPFPVAVYEGFPNNFLQLRRIRAVSGDLFWDADVADDPALCFCSAHFEGENVLVRNNFGRLAYRVYRVIDENGKKTAYWPQLESWAAGRRLVSLNVPLQPNGPEVACTGFSCKAGLYAEVMLFYMPILIPLCALCLLPCCCIAWCFGKSSKRRKQSSRGLKIADTEEEENTENSEEDEDDAAETTMMWPGFS
jgi:hypothetical protein